MSVGAAGEAEAEVARTRKEARWMYFIGEKRG